MLHGRVRHGSEEKIVIETYYNLLDYVAVTNAGQTLYVTTENKLRGPTYAQLRMVVYSRQLQHLDLANYGPVICPEPLLAVEPLDIRIQAIGDTQLLLQVDVRNLYCACEGCVEVAGIAGQALFNNKSHGELDCRELVAQHLKPLTAGVGKVRVHAEQTIRIEHRGVRYVHYSGPGRLLDVRQQSEEEVKHVELC